MTSMMEKSLFYSSILVVSGILLGGGYFYGGDLYKRTFVSQKSDVETQTENDFEPSAPSLEQSSSSTSLDDEVNQTTDYVKIK